MNNKEVAHLWANRSRKQASGSHFYFEGDTIYSYGSHFPIAHHYKGVVLVTTRGYSSTTAHHISMAQSAASHLTQFMVENPTLNPSGKDVRAYGERIDRQALACAKARNPASALEQLERLVNEGNAFCEKFGFKTRFAMPDEATLNTLKERAKASQKREKLAREAKQRKLEQAAQEAIAAWLRGESANVPYGVAKTYLRAVGTTMETSRGARVPLAEAEKAFRFARRVSQMAECPKCGNRSINTTCPKCVVRQTIIGWHRNGETFAVGDYQLDAVNEQGVVAGCHRIGWDEIERFAKLQGWL